MDKGHELLIKNKLGYYSVKNKPTEKELDTYYTEKYFQDESGAYQSNYSVEELKFFNSKIQQRFSRCQEIQKIDSGVFLDIGCGEGFALDFYRRQGWDVTGYDFSDYGLLKHNPKCKNFLKLGNINTSIQNAIKEKKKFDLIFITNVLEHLIEPEDFLDKLHSILNNNGIACITVPNDFSILQEFLVEKNYVERDYWVAIPDHLNYFNYESLSRLLKEKNYECHDIISDFPIDWFLLNQHSNYINKPENGKDAHLARVQIESMLSQYPEKAVNLFFSNLASLGMGRDLTAFISSKQ